MPVMARILLLLLGILPVISPSSSIGINYGLVANNLPSPATVIPLLRSIGVTKIKLYEPDPAVLSAFADTGVEFIVGVPDQCLSKVKETSKALAWIKANICPYISRTKITAVTIGNEVLTSNDPGRIQDLLPAMQGVHSALTSLGLDKQVAVTTPNSVAVLETSYPPSAGSFRRDLAAYISPILNFHAKTGSPFLINAYPYFAYKADPKRVTLDYVLFQPNQGVQDPASGLRYDNMLYAQIDAVHTAIDGLMGEAGKGVEVRVSETGWPSKGDEDEAGATPDNAKRYNNNLIRMLSEKKGTPLRPQSSLEVYIFALFNENMKPGPSSERNYGLFKPDGTPSYPLGISPSNSSSSSDGNNSGSNNGNSNGNGSTDDGSGSPVTTDGSTSTGYYSISAATEAKMRYGPYGCGSAVFWLQQVVVLGSVSFFAGLF